MMNRTDIDDVRVEALTVGAKKGTDYILNGTKTFITNAPIADFFIVLARESVTSANSNSCKRKSRK